MAYKLTDEDRRLAQQMAASVRPMPVQQTRPTQQPEKKKGFWLDQISTGGGIGGALGGAAAGAAAGSVVPVLGTAAGGILGALLGGALGGGAGEVAENVVTGDDLMKNVGKEAALNGIFGAGPIRLASLAARTGTGLAKGAGTNALSQAGMKAITDRPIRNILGKSLTGASDNMAVRAVGATPSQLTNFQKKFGEDLTNTLTRHNLVGKGLDDVVKTRSALDQQFGALVQGAGNVSKDSLARAFKSAYQPMLKSSSLDKRATGQALKQQADEVLKVFKGNEIPASELNAIKSEFDSLVNYTARAADPAKYGVNKGIADALRKTVQSAPGAKGLKETGMEISKLRQLEDIVQAQGNRGRGSNPIGITDAIGAGGGGAIFGIPGALVGAGVTRAANSPASKRVVTGALSKAGQRLGGQSSGLTVGGVAGRVGTVGALNSQLSEGMNQDIATNASANAMTDNIPMMNSNMEQEYQNTDEMSIEEPSIGGITKSQLEQMMAMAAMEGNSDAFGQMQALYEMLPQPAEAGDLTQGQQERADLVNMLDRTQALMDQGSIDYGPVSSRVNDIRAFFNSADPETLAFKNTVQGLRAAITKARAGASLTEGELRMLEQYTPTYTDTEQVVRSKLAELRQLYGSNSPAQATQPGIMGALSGL